MQQNLKQIFRFSDKCIWIGSCKFSQSSIWYFPSGVNMLRNKAKISPNTSEDIFQINFPENDEKKLSKYYHGDFASIWGAFTIWLYMRVMKQRFLESVLTKFFTVGNFGKTLAMTNIFSFKMFKIWCRFQKWNQKLRKTFSFFK